MRIRGYITAILLSFVLGNPAARADSTYFGTGFEGGIELSGLLKKIILPESLAIGSLSASHGYEVWKGKDSIPVLCTNQMEINQNFSLLGFTMGGEAHELMTVGRCDGSAEALAGTELSITLYVDPFDGGSKATAIKFTVHLSVDLPTFTGILNRGLGGGSAAEKAQRLFNLHYYLAQYASLPSTVLRLGPDNTVLLKILTLPILFSNMGNTTARILGSFSKNDSGVLQSWAKGTNPRLKDDYLSKMDVPSLMTQIFKDENFYQNRYSKNKSQVFLDFMTYRDAWLRGSEAGGYCNAVSVGVSLKTEVEAKLPGKFYNIFSAALGVGTAAIDEVRRKADLVWGSQAAVGASFLSHNFKKHSIACENLAEQNAKNFSELAILMGYVK